MHDNLKSAFTKVCDESKIPYSVEESIGFLDSGSLGRMDVVLPRFFGGDTDVWIDFSLITVAREGRESLLELSSETSGGGSIHMVGQKITKYGELARRNNAKLVPFIIDTFGATNPEALDLGRLIGEVYAIAKGTSAAVGINHFFQKMGLLFRIPFGSPSKRRVVLPAFEE